MVEDQPEVLAFAAEALTSLGYNVVSARNGREALQIIEERNLQFDILITDLIMPEVNGRELAETVIGRKPDVKVIFTSGYTADQLSKHELNPKGMRFIEKPYSLLDLAREVYNALHGEF